MGSSDFEAWLSAMWSLTAAQRRLAFRELTLAEAADLWEDGAEQSDSASVPAPVVETEPQKQPAATGAPASTRERGVFADVARERFAPVGCFSSIGGRNVRGSRS
jgi:hypothetical protein